MKKLILILLPILALGCQTVNTEAPAAAAETTPEVQAPIADESAVPPEAPRLTNTSGQVFDTMSFTDGVVKEILDEGDALKAIVIEAEVSYYFPEKRVETYELVYGGMNTVNCQTGDAVEYNQNLGTAAEKAYVTARSGLNPYMVIMSDSKPLSTGNQWYYSPDWLLDQITRWLSFRPVDSFSDAAADFYNRWKVEEEEPRGVTLHYFYNLDRIEFKTQLTEYPVPSRRGMAIGLVEASFYNRRQLFVEEQTVNDLLIDGHTIKLYWQHNFSSYLQEEYVLGDDIYIYGSIYAIDHENKEILVCIRDFAPVSIAEKYEERLKVINND